MHGLFRNRTRPGSWLFALLPRLTLAAAAPAQGYRDTPLIPGSRWRVHDADRPRPPSVDAGTMAAPAPIPSDATVLFDGSSLEGWASRDGGPCPWTMEDGALVVVPGSGNITSRLAFGDCQLHLEWLVPAGGDGAGQDRGNSGVFLMGLYEIQVLDTHTNPTYADGMAGALYGQFPPLVNASRPGGQWQSYDILFTAPRFAADGRLESPAFVTLLHNGVAVHNHAALPGLTAHKAVPPYRPHPPEGPLMLQDHRHPVRFRNIWVRPLRGYDGV
jgi:hypothetical protein